MKLLPQVLFWLGIISIPLAWLIWYWGPAFEPMRPVLSGVNDPCIKCGPSRSSCRAAGNLVAIRPVTLLVLSFMVEKMQE